MSGCLEPVFLDRAQPYRRLYPDLPGMGRSSADGVSCADDVLARLEDYVDDHIGDQSFVLIGESYGGYLARALVGRRPDQVLGLGLVCPVGRAVEHADRTVPEHQVLVREIEVDPASDFGQVAVVQTEETFARTQREIVVGLEIADLAALARIRRRWVLSEAPEAGPPWDRPAVLITGRQDASTGYADTWALLEHYPRATFAVLDTAGHNAQLERPELFGALVHDFLDRVEQRG